MKNTDIFRAFDMVVSLTEQDINRQLLGLRELHVIRPQLIIVQTIGTNPDTGALEYVYDVPDDASDIPADAAYLNAQLIPQVSVSETGPNITFVLQMPGGDARLWSGHGRLARLVDHTIDNWAYGVVIGMDLYKLSKDELADDSGKRKVKMPDHVREQLQGFQERDFNIRSLFMDFESADLVRFDPATTSVGDAGDPVRDQLIEFMQNYLDWLICKEGNPYVLGYAIDQADQDPCYYPDIPATLRPVGTTYTMYNDPGNDSTLSNLSFALVTAGGFGKVTSSAGNLDTSWFSAKEGLDGKMIISSADFIEAQILRPLYENLKSKTWEQLDDADLDVTQGNDYTTGRALTGSGFEFTISNDDDGDDHYVNTFTADFNNHETSVDIQIKGHIHAYKHVTGGGPGCNASASARSSVKWSTTITISVSKDAAGRPALEVSPPAAQIDDHSSHTHKNDCAKAVEWIDKILGNLLDAFTLFQRDFFRDLLDVSFTQTPVDLSVAVENLSSVVQTTLLLPGGDSFYIKSPAVDPEGHLTLALTSKSEH